MYGSGSWIADEVPPMGFERTRPGPGFPAVAATVDRQREGGTRQGPRVERGREPGWRAMHSQVGVDARLCHVS